MKARLKRIDTNSTAAFGSFQPEDPECFGIWLNASIGPADGEGADDFQIFVCNPAFLDRPDQPVESVVRHLVVDGPFDAGRVKRQLEAYVDGCVGESWSELVAQVSKVGVWEFEGYKP